MLGSESVYLAIAAVIGVIALFVIWTRHHHTTGCLELSRRLYPHQLRGREDLLEGRHDGRTMWRRSDGARGLWKRWRNSVIYVQLCQEQGEVGDATPEELQYVLDRATALAEATLCAFVLGLLTSAMPEVSSVAVQRTLSLYSEIVMHTHAIYEDGDASLCAARLLEVL